MPGVHDATKALMLGAPPTGQAEGGPKCLAVLAAVDHVLVIPRQRSKAAAHLTVVVMTSDH